MYLLLHLILLGMAVIFLIAGSTFFKKSDEEHMIESIVYPFLAMIFFATLAVSGTVEYVYSWPVIANVTNTSGTEIYSYTVLSHTESYPIHPINMIYMGLAFLSLVIVLMRVFGSLRR